MVHQQSLDIAQRRLIPMPVVPSFSGYAQKPDLARAYLGRQELAQQAASDAARIGLESQRLAQQRVLAEMEMSAKAAAQSQEQLRRAQEMEIEKSIQNARIGLQERQLQLEQAKLNQDIQEASRSFAAQQEYRSMLGREGADPLRVLMEMAPSMGVNIPAAAFPEPSQPGLDEPIEYTSPQTGRAYYRGEPEGAWRIQSQEYDVEGRMMRDEERTSIQKEIDTLRKAQLSAEAFGINEESKPKTERTKSMKEAYLKRKQQIEELENRLRSMRSQRPGRAELPAGMIPAGGATNQVGRFKVIGP